MAAIIKTDQLWLDQTTSSTVGAPALIFGADSLSGLYRIGTNNIGLAINGTKLLDLSSATFAITGSMSASGGLTGTVTNDSAAAGKVGEYVESVVGPINYPTSGGTPGNMTTISLTAGDWDVTFFAYMSSNGATITTNLIMISLYSGATQTDRVYGSNWSVVPNPTAATGDGFGVIPAYRVSLSGTSTVYGKIAASYSVATPYTYCRLSARRVR